MVPQKLGRQTRPEHGLLQGGEIAVRVAARSEEHTSELQSQSNLVCRLLLEKKKKISNTRAFAIPPPPSAVSPSWSVTFIGASSIAIHLRCTRACGSGIVPTLLTGSAFLTYV